MAPSWLLRGTPGRTGFFAENPSTFQEITSRPEIADVWKCIRGSHIKHGADALAPDDDIVAQKSFRCLLLGELSSMWSAQAVESDE